MIVASVGYITTLVWTVALVAGSPDRTAKGLRLSIPLVVNVACGLFLAGSWL